MLDQPPAATTITIADAAQWLGAALIGVLLWVWRALVHRVDKHDDALDALALQAQASEFKHGETGRILTRLQGQMDAVEAKVDEVPGRVVALLSARKEK